LKQVYAFLKILSSTVVFRRNHFPIAPASLTWEYEERTIKPDCEFKKRWLDSFPFSKPRSKRWKNQTKILKDSFHFVVVLNVWFLIINIKKKSFIKIRTFADLAMFSW